MTDRGVTRQQRRARLRDARRLGERLLKTGLPARPATEQLCAAALVLTEVLRGDQQADRAARFAAAALDLYRRTYEQSPSKLQLACRRGCSMCCNGFVSATAPEIFLLAARMRKKPLADRQRAIAGETATLSPAQRIGRKLPCIVLEADVCSHYAERPLMCRVTTSLDVAACIDEFEGRDLSGDLPVARAPIVAGGSVKAVMLATLRSQGLDDRSFELSGGLLAAIDTPEMPAQWLAGAHVLEAVREAPLDPEIDRAATAIADGLRQLGE